MEPLTQEEIDAVNKLHPEWEKRLTSEWISENILKIPYVKWNRFNYLGDYMTLGNAWEAMRKHFEGRSVFVCDGDGVYEETKWEVLYSGLSYAAQLQLIWSNQDCERYKLPVTPMALIYGAIITDILENEIQS